MSVVTFNYTGWAARYPEFATNVNSAQANELFNEATLYVNNTDSARVQDIPTRTLFLNMITAHLAKLYFGSNGDAASPLVGRITNASEGSVSVSAEMGTADSVSADWYNQTPYGASYWAASKRYRRGVYVAAPPYRFDQPYVVPWR